MGEHGAETTKGEQRLKTMVRVHEGLIAKTVGQVLEGVEEIAGAYLFGSALELCRPDSDIDIGLVIKPLSGEPENYYFKVALIVEGRLGRLDGHPFDVIPLNTASSIFAFKVIKNGHLIYGRDHETITDFIEIISRRYGENYPRYIKSLKDIVGT